MMSHPLDASFFLLDDAKVKFTDSCTLSGEIKKFCSSDMTLQDLEAATDDILRITCDQFCNAVGGLMVGETHKNKKETLLNLRKALIRKVSNLYRIDFIKTKSRNKSYLIAKDIFEILSHIGDENFGNLGSLDVFTGSNLSNLKKSSHDVNSDLTFLLNKICHLEVAMDTLRSENNSLRQQIAKSNKEISLTGATVASLEKKNLSADIFKYRETHSARDPKRSLIELDGHEDDIFSVASKSNSRKTSVCDPSPAVNQFPLPGAPLSSQTNLLASNCLYANAAAKTVDGWTVKSRKTSNRKSAAPQQPRKKDKSIIGCAADDDLISRAPRRFHYKVGKFRPSVEVDKIKDFVKKFTSEEPEVELIPMKHYDYYKIFKITLSENCNKAVLNPSNWPSGISVDRYYFRSGGSKTKSSGPLASNQTGPDQNIEQALTCQNNDQSKSSQVSAQMEPILSSVDNNMDIENSLNDGTVSSKPTTV